MTLLISKFIILLALAAATWASASLVINELDVASGTYPANEFVELKNVGTSTVNTAGWQLALYAFYASSGTVQLVDTQTLVDFDLGPGDYYVLCIYPERVLLCTQEVKTRSDGTAVLVNWIPNQNATVVLLNPAGDQVDMVGYGSPASGAGLGSAWYEGSGAAPGDSATWVGSAIARWPDGADTDDNAADFRRRCRTPGLTNDGAAVASESCASASDTNLVINEVDYTQDGGNDTREFIEFHNRGFVAIASTGAGDYRLRILDAANATVRSVSLSGSGFPFVVPVHGYYTLCTLSSGVCQGSGARVVDTPSTTNGYIDTATNWIPNPGDDGNAFFTIQLLRQEGSQIRVQDTVTYGGGSLSGYTPGTGVADLDASGTNSLGISRWPDGYDTKDNSNDWSARCITPGGENTNAATGFAHAINLAVALAHKVDNAVDFGHANDNAVALGHAQHDPHPERVANAAVVAHPHAHGGSQSQQQQDSHAQPHAVAHTHGHPLAHADLHADPHPQPHPQPHPLAHKVDNAVEFVHAQ